MQKMATLRSVAALVGFILIVLISGGAGPSLAQETDDVAGLTVDREVRVEAAGLLDMARFEEIHAASARVTGTGSTSNAFYQHVLDGLRSYQNRGEVYDRLSQSASRKVLRTLTLLQRLFLPLAWLVDRRAHRFQRQGIPIVAADLMPVAGLPAPETPPRWCGRLAENLAKSLAADLKTFRKNFRARVHAADFQGAADLAYRALVRVKAVEERERCHLAMTAHFIESVGLGALHAAGYVRDTQGAVIPLVKAFLTVQMLPMAGTLPMDLDAQALHARGIGILVNDVPAIPFAAEWEGQDLTEK